MCVPWCPPSSGIVVMHVASASPSGSVFGMFVKSLWGWPSAQGSHRTQGNPYIVNDVSRSRLLPRAIHFRHRVFKANPAASPWGADACLLFAIACRIWWQKADRRHPPVLTSWFAFVLCSVILCNLRPLMYSELPNFSAVSAVGGALMESAHGLPHCVSLPCRFPLHDMRPQRRHACVLCRHVRRLRCGFLCSSVLCFRGRVFGLALRCLSISPAKRELQVLMTC